MANVSTLEVFLYNRAIGTLTLLPGDRTIFAFNQSYIDNPKRATLSLSFKDSLGELITDFRPAQTQVPPFFSNLLPEGPLREYLAQKAGIKVQREFFLLWVLGRDLPGAVVIKPTDEESWPPGHGHKDDDPEKQRQTRVLRFSLAGVQLKFSAVMEATGGLTVPAEGVGGAWIVKLPSMKYSGVPENEYSMMSLARKIGIDVPDVQLHSLDEISNLPEGFGKLKGQALAVKRFDRLGDGSTVHTEDFAQVFGVYPDRKYSRASYSNIAAVIWAEIGEEGIKEFIRRLVFNTLIGNADMHLKNWSLIYRNKIDAALAPGYDFVSTIPYLDDHNMALKYARSKKMADLSFDELSYLSSRAKLPEKLVLDTGRETVERFLEAWSTEKSGLPLPAGTTEVIDNHIKSIPLVTGDR